MYSTYRKSGPFRFRLRYVGFVTTVLLLTVLTTVSLLTVTVLTTMSLLTVLTTVSLLTVTVLTTVSLLTVLTTVSLLTVLTTVSLLTVLTIIVGNKLVIQHLHYDCGANSIFRFLIKVWLNNILFFYTIIYFWLVKYQISPKIRAAHESWIK